MDTDTESERGYLAPGPPRLHWSGLYSSISNAEPTRAKLALLPVSSKSRANDTFTLAKLSVSSF